MPEYGVPLTSVFEHTYTIELYVPSAPSGAQNEPGRTFTDVDAAAAVVVVGATAMVVGAPATVVGVAATGAAVVVGEVTATGGALHPRMVVPAH